MVQKRRAEKREWVGLTDEEISDLWSWSQSREAEETATTQQHAFAYAIEAKLKEKNTWLSGYQNNGALGFMAVEQ